MELGLRVPEPTEFYSGLKDSKPTLSIYPL